MLKCTKIEKNFFIIREAFKKKKCNIFYIGGGGGEDRSSLHFFFQKHGLKWLNIAF